MTDKIKKILCCAAAAAVMTCSLCGCSADSDEEGTTTSSSDSAAGTGSDTDNGGADTLPAPAESGSSESTPGADGTAQNTDSGSDGEYSVPEDGMVPDESASGEANGPDEAAYASSYMNIAANGLSLTKIGWGLGKDRDAQNRPVDAVKAEEQYRELGARFLTEGNRICLTFDEGYENGYTAQILDVLKEKNVKAVFFVTYDYCRTSPELVRRMIDEGHTVGNHSYTHPSMPDCSEGEMTEEVTALHRYAAEEFGYEMTLFRFPKGEFSENALQIVKNLGYTSVFWSFAYSDWDTSAQPDPAEALQKIKDSTHSGIYLLHAVSSVNAEILGEVLDYWKAEGYEVGAEL